MVKWDVSLIYNDKAFKFCWSHVIHTINGKCLLQIRARHKIDSFYNIELRVHTCILTALKRPHPVNFVPGTKLLPYLIWSYQCTPAFKEHSVAIGLSISCLARAWSEGRERERTLKRPDGEAVPPMSWVGDGSSELPFRFTFLFTFRSLRWRRNKVWRS